MIFCRRTYQNRKRGFSLIEAAIVLAIVGLVLGGIWVARSSISQSIAIKNFSEGFIIAIGKMGSLYGKSDLPALNTNLSLIASVTKAVPADWVYDASSGYLNIPGVPYTSRVWVSDQSSRRLSIWAGNITKEICVNLVMRLSSLQTSRNLNIALIHVAGGTVQQSSFPLDLAWANTNCGSTPTGLELGFYATY